jgi:zinc transport system substrate-binding protein
MLAACAQPAQNDRAAEQTLTVSTSFYPAAFLAQSVGGKHVRVVQLTPAGIEPHDFEPSARDIAGIEASAVFIYNGIGVDAWADRVHENIASKHIAVVRLSEHATLLTAVEDGHDEHEETGHEESEFDPHIWLDPVQLSAAIPAVRDALSKASPAHAKDFEANAAKLQQELSSLTDEMRQGLSQCNHRTIVVSHNAFRYMAQRFNFESVAIAGLSPDQEPSPSQMADIVDTIRNKGITHVFFETLASPKIAQTIADEAGVETLVLNPIEGITQEEERQGEDYLSLMRKNLQNLRIAMACK